jgi:FtsZ-interacting cell division protein ZipA
MTDWFILFVIIIIFIIVLVFIGSGTKNRNRKSKKERRRYNLYKKKSKSCEDGNSLCLDKIAAEVGFSENHKLRKKLKQMIIIENYIKRIDKQCGNNEELTNKGIFNKGYPILVK